LLDAGDCEDDETIAVLKALLTVFPPTAGGGKSKYKRKKISPQQAFSLLVREEEVCLSFELFIVICSSSCYPAHCNILQVGVFLAM